MSALLSVISTAQADRSGMPVIFDGNRCSLGLRRQFVAEDLTEQTVHNRVQPFLCESVAVLVRLPDIEVPRAAFGPLEREVSDETFV